MTDQLWSVFDTCLDGLAVAQEETIASTVLRSAARQQIDPDDVAVLFPHTYFEIEATPNQPLAFAWVFDDDDSVLFQAAWDGRPQVVRDGCVRGRRGEPLRVWPLPPDLGDVIFDQRCAGFGEMVRFADRAECSPPRSGS